MDNLSENFKDDSKLDFAPRERLQLCLNILPNQVSLFHYLYEKVIKKNGKSSVDKVAEVIQKFYDAEIIHPFLSLAKFYFLQQSL